MGIRYGLVGTGFWAEIVHAATSATHPGDALIAQINTGRMGHPCDVHFGARIVDVLQAIEDAIKGKRLETVRLANEQHYQCGNHRLR